MTTQYFRIDEYFTAQQESKKHLAYFVLGDMVFRSEGIQTIMTTAMKEGLSYNNEFVVANIKSIVKSEVAKLQERLGYPFKEAPIEYIVGELMEHQMDLYSATLKNIKKYGQPYGELANFIALAEKDEAGLKDLMELFGYNYEPEND